MDPTKYIKLKNETLLFFVEKLLEIELEANNKKSRTLHDLSCQFGSKGFTKEMRQIAGGSQSGLKKFLGEYPTLFEISGDLVSYRETLQPSSGVKSFEVCDRDPPPEKNEAVEYFRERMIDYGLGVSVPVKSLLGHRSQAPTSIRHVSGQHYEEFLSFLQKYPETFKVSGDAVILTEFEPKNNGTHAGGEKYDREHSLGLIQFYGGILKDRGPMLVEQLFHASAANSAAKELKSPNDLKTFFQMHTECFVVTSSLVTLSDSFQQGVDYLQNMVGLQKGPSTERVSIEITKKPSLPLPTPLPQPLPSLQSPSQPQERPTLKTRVSAILLKTLETNETARKQVRKNCNLTFADASGNEEELKNYLISKTEIVSNVRKAKEICKNWLSEPFLSVDLEGVNLGDENGVVRLLQVCCRGDVFLFDVLTSRGVMEEVRGVLEAEAVIKVLHDCRNDSSSLYKEFGILLKNVFDTQAANVVLDKSNKTTKNASLNGLAANFQVPSNIFKDRVKSLYRHDPRFWSRRPLTKQMIVYAAADVVILEKIYEQMSPLLLSCDAEALLHFGELVEEQILSCIHPDEIRQRRKIRKNEKDLEELKSKIESGFHAGEVGVLSNRELRLLKHLTLPEPIKNALKSSLKIAKKLEKLEKRDSEARPNNCNSTSSSELTSLEILPNGEQSSLGEFYPQTNFIKVEELLTGLSALVQRTEEDGGSGDGGQVKDRTETATQTSSTGDIVVMRVWEEEQAN